MRIITGKIKGMNLFSPQNMDIRPTADRVKESVFNILGNYFWDCKVLDIFAGSGNLGLESWSRGAAEVHFVEISPQSLALLNKNIQKAKVQDYVKVYRTDALRSIAYFANQEIKYDYIFADPPYNKGFVERLLLEIDKTDVLTNDGIIIVEHSTQELIDVTRLNKLSLVRKERYGDTAVSFFKKTIGR